METIKFEKVVSVSSEIPGHEAKHLLNPEVNVQKSWLCFKGSQKGTVILKLEQAAMITKVHLGNANSAFVEIAVGCAAGSSGDFQTLIPTSTFMSPNDSKASENGNKVRFFEKSDFDPAAVGKRWDLIKVVCSQPFNKHIAFGLCFLKIHGEAPRATTATLLRKHVDEDIPVGAFFRKKKDPVHEEKSLSISERIREAQKPEALAKHTPVTSMKVACKIPENQSSMSKESRKRDEEESDNRRNTLLGLEDEDEPKDDPPLKKQKESECTSKRRKENEPTPKGQRKDYPISKRQNESDSTSRKRKEDEPTPKRKKEDEPSSKGERKGESSSGVEERHDRKRDSKVDFGTPKRQYEQKRKRVDEGRKEQKKDSGSGYRVEKDSRDARTDKPKKVKSGKPFNRLMEDVVFVISGYQNPERGTYRSYALGMGAKYRPDWIDGVCTHLVASYLNTPKCNQVKGKGKIVSKDWVVKCHEDKKRYPWRRFALDKNDRRQAESEEEIDVEETFPPRIDPAPSTSYLFGTGKKAATQTSKNSPPPADNSQDSDADNYDLPTDDEGDNEGPSSPPKLPDYFRGMTFYVDENIVDKPVLERYIIAYDGIVCEKLNDDVQYFITSQRGAVIDILKKSAKNFKAVSPTWIQAVNCNERFIPAANFSLQ